MKKEKLILIGGIIMMTIALIMVFNMALMVENARQEVLDACNTHWRTQIERQQDQGIRIGFVLPVLAENNTDYQDELR